MARRAAARSLRPRKHNRFSTKKSVDQNRSLSHQALERRELLAAGIGPQLISVSANSGENFRLAQANTLKESPTQLTFRFDGSQQIDPTTLNAITIERSGGDASFLEGNEIRITPGFLGFGDSQRIVVARFAETLPDDQYRIRIAGFDDTNAGIVGLRNTLGELFDATNPTSQTRPEQVINFQVEIGPQVVAVVPQPITGFGAARVQQRSQIHVYFNNDPLSNPALGVITTTGSPGVSVVNPNFYNLYFTGNTVENTDDVTIRPNNVIYDPSLNRATLDFGQDLALLPPAVATGGSATYRLRIGSSQALPAAPLEIDEANAGDLFTTAQNLGMNFSTTSSVVISGQISAPVGNTIAWPGLGAPGIRDDRRDPQVVGRADTTDGVNVFYYNFADLYGKDAGGNDLENAITPPQKQRAREILSLYSQHLGIEFIETENRGLQIVTGDMRALVEGATTGAGAPFQEYRVNDEDPTKGVLILDASENWFDDYGLSPDARPSWFVEALRGIGNLLGLGPTFEQVPGVASGSNSALYDAARFGITGPFSIEPDFLSTSDIVPLQALHRPEIRDVDLYRFNVNSPGKISIETLAQRLDNTSSLNTDIKLWKYNTATFEYDLVARNDDFYSVDSFIGVDVSPNANGTTALYVVGITASGNDDYDPNIPGSGGGGRSQGEYQMRITFQNNADPSQTIRDTDGSLLDGDGDGIQGGDFNFWFRTAKTKATATGTEARTLFVDKSGVDAVGSGDLPHPDHPSRIPYRTINYAFSQARPGDIVRILPSTGSDGLLRTSTNNPVYEIARTGTTDSPASDGTTFNVPRGVTVMVDAGTIFKLSNAKISVGSERIDEDRSLAALQILGVPTLVDSDGERVSGEVNFTSFNDETVGIDRTIATTSGSPGEWAGIEFRNDFDYSEGRPVWETEGIFLDYVSHANIRFGGGSVSATQAPVTPIQMLEARPTLIHNTIRNSRDAAMSADPNSFLETNFHAPIFQRVASFTSDYDRVGPDIRGNRLTENSINGLFISVQTPAVGEREPMTVAGRFNDRDIVHALSEVLVLQGQPGGSILLEQRPDVLSVIANSPATLPAAGTLVVGDVLNYRVTFINLDGSESLASLPTSSVTVAANQTVQLQNLPSAPVEFSGRRLYRLNPTTGNYDFVTQLDRGSTSFTDTGVTRGGILPAAALATTSNERLLPRFDARLSIDPGIVIKLDSARIEASFGADFYAEGTDGNPVVFTSRLDDEYGAGGTFDTNNDGNAGTPVPGSWGGLVFRQGSTASLDFNVIRFAGGTSAGGGDFATFNPVEILQADVRIANSLFANNAAGSTGGYDIRDSIGFNGPATIFVRGAQPIIVDNIIRDNAGAAISINPDSLNYLEVTDRGRSTGIVDLYVGDNDNQGPLIAGNRLGNNTINGMMIRSESLTTESVWDDTDIVHVVENRVYAWNHHHRSGLRLKSDPNQSLVVKVQSGGSLHASQYATDIEDSIGGTIQVIGQPGFPVVLTSINDSGVGAGFTPDGLPQNATIGTNQNPLPGDWRGIVIEPGANDRNVAFVLENEQAIATASRANAVPTTAQVIGSLARNEVSSDENRRVGFNIRGTLSQNSDIDVYKFFANGATEVYFDIDDTSFGLDTVVELIDINGNILAASNNSSIESTDRTTLFRGPSMPVGSVLPLYKTGKKIVENPNVLDAGMRVILPGNSSSVNEYFVRVRSSNLRQGDPVSRLTDPNFVNAGLSKGQYQLSLRLRETDEIAGTTIRLADIRFATTAIDVPAAPSNSPLAGEFAEELTETGLDLNNSPQNVTLAQIRGGTATVTFTNGDADPLGALNQSNQGVLRVSGELGNQVSASDITPDFPKELDIDVFRVVLRASNQSPDIINENRFVSTIFDIDYADQFGGPNTSLAVYNSLGQLILHGRDSSIADDQGRPRLGNDPTNLAGGSGGTLDAYIGPVELQEGTYYVVVSSAQMIPASLNQLFEDSPVSSSVRILPIDSSRRLAEFGFDENFIQVNGLPVVDNDLLEDIDVNTAADLPTIRPLFDETSIVPFKLEDMRLFISLGQGISGTNNTTLISVDPFTGALERTIGQFGPRTGDLAIRRDGELFAYTLPPANNPDNGNTGNFLNISSVNAATSGGGDDGITFQQNNQAGTGTEAAANAQFLINAMSFFPQTGSGGALPGDNPTIPAGERLLVVGNREGTGRGEIPFALTQNILYSMEAGNGAATNAGSTAANTDRNFGTGTYVEPFGPASNKFELGVLDTGQFPDSPLDPMTGLAVNGGTVTGIGILPAFGGTVTAFAVTDEGYVYTFNPSSLRTVDVEPDTPFPSGAAPGTYNRVINTTNNGRIAPHPNDLDSQFNGFVEFSSLTLGPRLTERGSTFGNGPFANVLFGVTSTGWIYTMRVNPITNQVEPAPILANGSYAVQITDTAGTHLITGFNPVGAAFSTREENLWHVTSDFATPFATGGAPNDHGTFIGHNQTRTRVSGGASLYFGNEIDGNANNNTLDGGNGVLNPGGAHGTAVSAPFSLEDYSAGDKPTLYFTYLLETQADRDYQPQPRRGQADSFRVFAAGDDGQWRLLATNNTHRSWSNLPAGQVGGDGINRGDEFDYFATNGGIPVQELFENNAGANSTNWRQARVDLSPLAGSKNVQLRFDFSTAGGMHSRFLLSGHLTELQATAGTDVVDGSTFTFQSSDLFNPAPPTTFEFVRGASMAIPSGNFLLDGQQINFVDSTGATTTVTLTTDLASTATNPVFFDRTNTSDEIATAIATAINVLNANLVAVANGDELRVPDAASFTLNPARFGASAISIPAPSVALAGQSLQFTNHVGKQTTITLQTAQQVVLGSPSDQITVTADVPGFADGVQIVYVNQTGLANAIAAFNTARRVITVRFDAAVHNYAAIATAIENLPNFSAAVTLGDGTTLFAVAPGIQPASVIFPRNEVFFNPAGTANELAQAIARKLNGVTTTFGTVITPGLAPALGASAVGDQLQLSGAAVVPITIPADLASLDGQSLLFLNDAGNEVTVTLTTSLTPGPNEISFDPVNDTPDIVAQRLAIGLATIDPSLGTLDANFNLTVLDDLLFVPGARGLSLDAAFFVDTINPTSFASGTTASQFLASGNVPIFYNERMTSIEVRDAIRTALAAGLVDTSTTNGVSQATIANYPVYGTNRIRVFNQTLVTNASNVGFSTFLPGDEFGSEGSLGVFGTANINTRPASGNDIQGVYIDDIVIGFAERGEVVYNAPVNRDFIVNPEVRSDTFADDQQPEFLDEILVGNYTLEIRNGAEYGVPEDYDPIRLALNEQVGFGRSFDTNDRLSSEGVTLIAPRGIDLVDGDIFVLSNGSQQVTFEFDNDNNVQGGRVRVPFTGAGIGANYSDTADEASVVATAIRNAINSPQAFNILGIYAAGRDGSELAPVAGNRIELFGKSIQLNPSSGRFIKVDLVAEETFYGRESARSIPLVDHANDTVIDVVYPDTFARASVTNFVNGMTDTLVAVGKIGDQVVTRDGGGVIHYRNQIFNDQFIVSQVVNNAGNILLPLAPETDIDLVKIYLRAGDVIDVDLDTIGWNLGTEYSIPTVAIYGEVAGADPQLLAATSLTAAPGEVNLGAFIGGFVAPNSGFYYVAVGTQGILNGTYGEYQLTVRPSNLVSNGSPIPRDVLMVDYHFDKGDTNVARHQGQFIIESNFITDYSTTGIRATFGNAANDNDATFSPSPLDRRPGSAATLRNPNTQRLLPGTVISNNLLVSTAGTAIVFTGETAPSGDSPAPVPFGRIVNNTVVGPGTGTGILVASSASPTVLNNVVSGFNVGLSISADSISTVEGGNAYQNNNTNSNRPLATSSIVIANTVPLFQDPAARIFIPAANSAVIDSSFASFGDRTTFVSTVKAPLGIAASPIIAPEFDAYGIPRFDDPTVTTPSGVGSNVFIDRGAIDRADFTRPRAALVNPVDFIDGQGIQVPLGDTDPDSSFVRLPLGSPAVSFFEVQLLDPAGSGPDVRTITEESVILTEDGIRLQEGIDYIFGYSDNSRLIRLTPTAGLWRPDSVYEVTLNNQNRVLLNLPTGNLINDGDRYVVTDSAGRRSTLEFDSGYVLQVPQTLGLQVTGANNAFNDGDTFDITSPSGATRTFEINLSGAVATNRIAINLQNAGTVEEVRDVFMAALSVPAVATALDLVPRAFGIDSLQIGSLAGHSITSSNPVAGLTFIGVADGVTAGDQFSYQSGPDNVLFEFTFGGVPSDPSAVAIPINRSSTIDEIGTLVADTLKAQPLGLVAARSLGEGRVLVGGNVGEVLSLIDTSLQVIGTPGVSSSLALTVPTGTAGTAINGRTFSITNGAITVNFVFTTNPALVTPARRVVVAPGSTEVEIALAMANEINAGFAGALSPSVSGNVVTLGEQSAVIPPATTQVLASVSVGTSPLVVTGVSGGSIPVPFIPSSLFSPASSAASFATALATSPLSSTTFSPGGGTLLFSQTSQIDLQTSTGQVTTIGANVPAIADLAGNPVASNRDNGETRFTIIMPEVQFDFGDAPNTYGTLFANNGPRHSVSSTALPRLGRIIDTELNGQPFPTSDDALVPITATLPNSSPLFSIAQPITGSLNITINDITPTSGAQLRVVLNTVPTIFELVSTGIAPLGTNRPVPLLPGDTADMIAARLADAIRAELTSSGDSLIVLIDPLTPTVIELRTLDDEDGVAIGTFSDGVRSYSVFLTADAPSTSTTDPADVLGFLNPLDPLGSNIIVTATGAGLVDAWIDFNKNGTFDDNEQVLRNAPVVDGTNTLRVVTPAGTTDGPTWARFRLSNGGNLGPTGVAIGGEVEDYPVEIINIPLPSPNDDSFDVNEDSVLDTETNLTLDSVIDNDDVPTETFLPVRFFIGQQPTNGTLTITDPTSGRFVYTPAPDFSGVDTFTYRLSTQSNAGATAPSGVTFATVTINVRPVNDAPLAIDKTVVTLEDTPVTVTAATLLAGAIADADPRFPSGTSSLPWNEANQNLRVLSLNSGGVVLDASNFTTTTLVTPRGSIRANFDTTTGDLIDFTYTPGTDLNRDNVLPIGSGPVFDTFAFTIQDDGILLDPVTNNPLPGPFVRLTATATVSVDVKPENDAPTATTDQVSVGIVGTTNSVTPWTLFFTDPAQPAPVPTEDVELTIPSAYLLANDLAGRATTVDENNAVRNNDGSLSITAVNPVTPGLVVTLDANNNVVLTPPANVYGDVVFTYTIIDQGVNEAIDGVTRTPNPLSITGTVTVTLQPVNDAPVAFDRNLTFIESSAPGAATPFTFTATGLLVGAVGETPAVPGTFASTLTAPFNESEQTLRVIAFRTTAGEVNVSSLAPSGTGTLTLAAEFGGSYEFDFENGAFTTGRFFSTADYNRRTPFDPNESFEFLIADDGRTTRPQGGGFVTLPSAQAVNFATATITVTESNDAPVFNAPGSINILERDDSGTTLVPNFATGILPGPATAFDELQRQTVSFEILTSLSTVPAGLMLSAPQIAPDGTLSVFPAPDAVGNAIYVFEAVDAEAGTVGFVERRTRGTVTIAVRPVNDAPIIDPAAINTSQTLSADEAWSVNANGVITYTLKEDNTGPLGVTSPYIINVRRNPAAIGYERIGLLDVFNAGPPNEEDSTEGGSQVLRLVSFNATTAAGGTIRVLSRDANNEITQLEYIPPADFNENNGGIDSFTFTVQDNAPAGGETFNLGTGTLVENQLSSIGTVNFVLRPVNDPPRFNVPFPEVSVLEDTGSFTLEDFATNIFAGPANSAFDEIDLNNGQRVTFAVTAVSNVAGLFTVPPTVSPNGTLTFQAAADAYGQAIFEVRATDNGPDNATRGDIVSSAATLITINVRPVNDRPVLNTTTPLSFTLNEDAAVDLGNGTTTTRGTLIPLRGATGQRGLLDMFNVGPANEAANITPGGNQTLRLADPIPAGTTNGGILTREIVDGVLVGLRYTPRANFNGTDSFVYGVIDNGQTSDLDGNIIDDFRTGFTTVSLNVIARNDAPVFGGAPSVTVEEDATTSTIVGQTIIANWATNIQAGPAGAADENDPITGQTVTFIVTPVAGNPTGLFATAPTVTPTGTLSFTTTADANGSAVFTIVARDSGIASVPLEFNTSSPPRTFTITVNPVNDPPTFTPGANVTVEEDSGPFNSPTPYATNILPGPPDEVAAGQTVRFEVTTPSSGAALFAPDGAPRITDNGFLLFTPAANANGVVVVSVVAIDSEGLSTAAVPLTITINAVNDVPVANNDTFASDEDTLLVLTPAQLLANDVDPDVGQAQTIVSLPALSLNGATVRIGAGGNIEYDPRNAALLQALAPGQTRSDTFTYRVQDAAGAISNVATVTINVAGINDAPILLPDTPTLAPSGNTIIRPLENDVDIDGTIDPASLRITLQPAFGSVVVEADGTLVYTPFEGFRGQDIIRYTVADNLGLRSAEQTITIDINRAPIAVNDTDGTFRDEPVEIKVAANDSDPDGSLDLDSIQIITPPVRGTATPIGGGIVRYLPEPGFTGIEFFEYTIRDNAGRASNVGRVSVQTVGSRLQNPRNFTDVNANGQTTALDALLIINLLSRAARQGLGSSIPVLPTDEGPDFFDTDGNLVITANDALRVINQIARDNRAQLTGEAEAAPTPQVASVSTTPAVLADSVVATFDEKDYQVDFSTPSDNVVSAISLSSSEEDKEKQASDHVAAIDAAWADAATL